MKYQLVKYPFEKKIWDQYPDLAYRELGQPKGNIAILDYNRYEYDIKNIFSFIKRHNIKNLLIRVPSVKFVRSNIELRNKIKDLYLHSFKIRKRFSSIQLSVIDRSKYGWILNDLPSKLVYIEPTNACNHKCYGCNIKSVPARGFVHKKKLMANGQFPVNLNGCDKNKKIGWMSFDNFKKILAMFPLIQDLRLYQDGEPLLHPDIIKFIEHAKDNNAHAVRIFTNFNVRNPNLIKSLAKSRLDELIIGIEGTTNKVYQKFRKGGDLGLVINNIKRLKMHNPNCKLTIQFLPSKFNEHQILSIRELAKYLGVDRLSYRVLQTENREILTKYKRFRFECKIVNPKDIADVNRKQHYFFCREMMDSLSILWNGDAYPCSYLRSAYRKGSGYQRRLVPKELFPINILESGLSKKWLSRAYFNLRYDFFDKGGSDICKSCKLSREGEPRAKNIIIRN